MRERIQFLVLYFGFWVVFFVVARIIFLGFHIEDTKLLTLQTIGGIFWYGIPMDFAMAGYLSIIPFLFVAISNFIRKSRLENWIFSYTFFVVFFISFIVVADLQVFNTWGYRLDATPLQYLKSPREAWASVSSSPLVQLFISFVLLLIVASFIIYRIITKNIDNWNHISNLPMIPIVTFLTAALIIPIRGGFQLAPMSQSTVYFSENNFANIAAVNAPWNFFSSIVNNTTDKVNPYTYLPKHELESNIKSLFESSQKNDYVLRKNVVKPNILVIIWESFTEKAVHQVIDNQAVMPNFNRLLKEGIYFSNIYASGDRTHKGIPAILSGYPAQAKTNTSIITVPNKSAKLPVLSKDLEHNGYTTSFYYGGETDFANIKSYLYSSYFQKIISKNDFDKKDWNSKWGAHDGVVYARMLEDLSKQNQPFFATMLTLSSHEPFEVPMNRVIKGEDKDNYFLFMNSMYYADKSFGEFIDSAKKQPWWQNTLVVVLADHGSPLPKTGKKADDFHIPMLWLGGALEKTNLQISKIASQTDFAATVLKQLNKDAKPYTFSKNIFDPKTKEWAYFTFVDGFGFVQKQKTIIYDNIGRRIIQQQGKNSDNDLDLGKALEQRSFQDYLDK